MREFALYDLIKNSIARVSSFEALIEEQLLINKYLKGFLNAKYVTYINDNLVSKERELIKVKAGSSAPSFTLKSSDDKEHRLKDFLGKVIYIDLWASWCGPCRKEFPSLKSLFKQFEEQKDIVFISIAVNDKKEDWYKALRLEELKWLQLIDEDAQVSNGYFVYSIPRYIIIDKLGKVVSFDAPGPSSGEVEKVLQLELSKQ